MHQPALDLPGAEAFVGKLAVRIAEGLGQASAAADPRAVPALAVEIGQYRHGDGRQGDAPDQQEDADRSGIDQLVEAVFEKEGVIERPDVLQIDRRGIQQDHDLWDQKRKGRLEEHHAAGSNHLIAIVAILNEHTHAHHQDGQRVEEPIQEPLAGRVTAQSFAEGVDEDHPVDQILRIEVQNDVKGDQEQSGGDAQPTPAVHRAMINMVVLDARQMPVFRQDVQEGAQDAEADAQQKEEPAVVGQQTLAGRFGHGETRLFDLVVLQDLAPIFAIARGQAQYVFDIGLDVGLRGLHRLVVGAHEFETSGVFDPAHGRQPGLDEAIVVLVEIVAHGFFIQAVMAERQRSDENSQGDDEEGQADLL